MTAIAFDIPVEIERIAAGLERFLSAEVIARHEKHLELLEDPRRRYGSDGRYTPEVVELIRQVRMASAAAGYFNLCVPTSLGGLGQGYLAYYVCWEMVNRLCGPHHWLGTFALSHWAFGPTPMPWRSACAPSTAPSRPTVAWASPTRSAWYTPTTRCG